MSRWAAENPDTYDSLIRRGVTAWLITEGERQGYNRCPDHWVSDLVDLLYFFPDLREALAHYAAVEIAQHEAELRADRIDHAKERGSND